MRLRRAALHLPVHPSPSYAGPILEDRALGVRVAIIVAAALAVMTGVQVVLPELSLRALRVSASVLGAEIASTQTGPSVWARAEPREVRAIYLTSWSAATPSRLREAMSLAKTTEVNSVVIDIKDYTGTVVFKTNSPLIGQLGTSVSRLDLPSLVDRLHAEGIYVIARIAAFQDQQMLKVKPYLAVRDSEGRIWYDRKGLGWVDPASPEVWEYLVEIGRATARAGVDELNFDYIRFPSDGNLSELRYPVYEAAGETKRQVIRRFFEYLTTELRPTGAVLSADLFGLATVRPDDMGIGQVIEDAFLYFDYISPMVYPSHYARGFMQFDNPAEHPYQVVRYSLVRAGQRRAAYARMLASIPAGTDATAPSDRIARIRPWLQAFDLGALYPPPTIRRQMEAVYDVGLTSGWLLWNPSNHYQPATFEPELPERTSSR